MRLDKYIYILFYIVVVVGTVYSGLYSGDPLGSTLLSALIILLYFVSVNWVVRRTWPQLPAYLVQRVSHWVGMPSDLVLSGGSYRKAYFVQPLPGVEKNWSKIIFLELIHFFGVFLFLCLIMGLLTLAVLATWLFTQG